MTDAPPTCPHCGSTLSHWLVPEETSWDEEFLLVCFNDDCSYYKEGWDWMKEQYNQRASYRYSCSPVTGGSTVLPVWSASALRDRIAEESERGDE